MRRRQAMQTPRAPSTGFHERPDGIEQAVPFPRTDDNGKEKPMLGECGPARQVRAVRKSERPARLLDGRRAITQAGAMDRIDGAPAAGL